MPVSDLGLSSQEIATYLEDSDWFFTLRHLSAIKMAGLLRLGDVHSTMSAP